MTDGNYIIRERIDLHFAQVPKTALRDKKLSLKAKGLYAYLFSLPEDWKVYKTEVVKNFSDGKDSLNSAFKELENNGYLISEGIRDSVTQQFKGYSLRLLIEPLRETRSGETGNGLPGNGKTATTNTDSTNTVETNSSLPNGKDPVDLFSDQYPQEKNKRFKKPNFEEVEIYFKALGFHQLANEYQDHYNSNGWKVGPNKMSDWQAAARNWIKRYKEKLADLERQAGTTKNIKSFIAKHQDA